MNQPAFRPTYERPADRSAEREVIDELLTLLGGLKAHKLPRADQIDFAITDADKNVVAVAEVKCRTQRYPTLMLSASKWLRLQEYRSLGIDALLVVRWPEGTFIAPALPECVASVEIGGRIDRGDPEDMEMVVHVRGDAFKRMA